MQPGRDDANEYDDDGRRWALWERKVIGPADDPMLVRYRLLRTPAFGVFVHKLLREDRSRDPHDHPWPFLGIVLAGGYDEQVWRPNGSGRFLLAKVDRGPLTAGYRPATGLWHRFVRLHRSPTWTLVVVGRKCNRWGFLLADGTTVPARDYAPETYLP